MVREEALTCASLVHCPLNSPLFAVCFGGLNVPLHISSRFAQRDIRRLRLRPTLRFAPGSQTGEPLYASSAKDIQPD